MSGRVLTVADVASVGLELNVALAQFSSWRPESLALPAVGAGRGRLLHTIGATYRAAAIPIEVRRGMRRVRPDVVHLHWARFAPLMPRSARPLVVHAHGSDIRGRTTGLAGRVVMAALERADAVLASTPDLLAHLPDGAKRLPSPVDVDTFRPVESGTRPAKPLRVLILARLSEVKGGRHLVELARDLKRMYPKLDVVAFGGGPYDAAARGAGVTLLGPTDKFGVAAALRSADLVVGQQRLGVIGLSELEAMACGLPVVAFVERRFRDDGLPVVSPDREGEGLLDLCVALLDDAERRARLGTTGRQFVEAVHAPQVVAHQLAKIYEGVTS